MSDHLATLADRLRDAMEKAEVQPMQLATACNVTHVAVGKWLSGATKNMSAANLAAAGRALGVQPDWLRTGRLPRERDRGQEEREIDEAMALLKEARGPLAALVAVIDRLTSLQGTRKPRRG